MNSLMKLFVKGHVLVYQKSKGRLGATMRGRNVILLTTRGKKTGRPRTVPVMPLIEGDQMYVMASMAGAPVNPAWFANIAANPDVDVQLGPEHWHARAAVLEPGERDAVWARVKSAMPDFGEYEKRTTRVIPVVRLTRAS